MLYMIDILGKCYSILTVGIDNSMQRRVLTKEFGGFYQRLELIWIKRKLKKMGKRGIVEVKVRQETFYEILRWCRKRR